MAKGKASSAAVRREPAQRQVTLARQAEEGRVLGGGPARTLAPAAALVAKVKSVDGVVAPSRVRLAKAAAWPSMGWLTFFSLE